MSKFYEILPKLFLHFGFPNKFSETLHLHHIQKKQKLFLLAGLLLAFFCQLILAVFAQVATKRLLGFDLIKQLLIKSDVCV